MSNKGWKKYSPNFKDQGYSDFYFELLSYAPQALEAIHSHNGKEKPQVNIAYLEDESINAKVRYNDDHSYNIGVNIGLPSIIHFYFNNILRTQNYLDHIGAVQNEEVYRDFKNGIPIKLPTNLPFDVSIPQIINGSRPIDDDRAAAAVALTKISVSFCIYHEVAHIELGHVKTSLEEYDELEFLEFDISSLLNSKELRLRKVWEYEADKIAAIMIISDMMNDDNFINLSNQFCLEQNTIDDIIGIAMSSIYALFHIIEEKTKFWKVRRTHPKPLVRTVAVMEEIIAYVLSYFPNRITNEEEFRETIISSILTTHYSWSELNLKNLTNLNNPKVWGNLFKSVDQLEKDRIELNYIHRKYSIDYPFVT